jgi:hypothetical protein
MSVVSDMNGKAVKRHLSELLGNIKERVDKLDPEDPIDEYRDLLTDMVACLDFWDGEDAWGTWGWRSLFESNIPDDRC